MITKAKFIVPFAVLAALGIVVAPGAADARGDNALTFRLGLKVPTICRIEVHGSVAATTGEGSATAEEFCNAPAGYRVLAVHAAPEGERIWFEYDGRRVPASASGTTTLVEERTAAHRVRPFAVIYPQRAQAALPSVTLQIVPR